MQLKPTILSAVGLRTLKHVVDKLEIHVDRRSAEAMRAVLTRSRRATLADLLRYMRKDELSAACELLGLPNSGRREKLREQLERVEGSVTQGLGDGSRIKSYGRGWVVVDRHGLFLSDPKSATWVVSPKDRQMPAAVFPTPVAAYLAWMQSQQIAKDRMVPSRPPCSVNCGFPR